MTGPPDPAPPAPARPLREIAVAMLRMGGTAFGGPAAHVALMEAEFVTRRGWLSREAFLDLLGASALIPGPTSTQVAIHLGMHRGGWRGLWLAGIGFISPAVAITLCVAWAYVAFGKLPATRGVMMGLQPAVLAVVAVAVVKLAQTALKSVPLGLLSAAVLAAYLCGGAELWLLLVAGTLGMLGARPWTKGPAPARALWLAGLGAPAVAVAQTPSTLGLFLYFLKLGTVLFGSGYVLLAFLQRGLVHNLHWATEQQILDAVAVGQFTPGPVFSTATFIGYVIGGWKGAVAASVGIFLPSFVMVWVTHPLLKRMRESPWSGGFLDGINAGSVALMAGVLWPLGRSALRPGWPAWLIAAAALAVLLRTRVGSAWVLAAAAMAGLAWSLLR